MRSGLLILLGLVLAGCSVEIPEFLGREGTGGSGTFQLRDEPPPDPVAVPLRQALLEPALHGVIVRARSVAPTQGYYGADLRPSRGGAPDAAGIVGFELVAVPPDAAQATGPERTRLLDAAVFVPTLALKDLRGFRVAGVNQAVTLPLR